MIKIPKYFQSAYDDGKIKAGGRIILLLLVLMILFHCFTIGADNVYAFFTRGNCAYIGAVTFWAHVGCGLVSIVVKAFWAACTFFLGFLLFITYGWLRFGYIGSRYNYSEDESDIDIDMNAYTNYLYIAFIVVFGSFPEKDRIFHPAKYAKELLSE